MSLASSGNEGPTTEIKLILCCVSGDYRNPGAGRLRDLLSHRLNWPEVVAKACEHHVETLVYERLESLDTGLVSAAALESLRSTARKAAGLAVLYFAELVRIQRIFDEAAVPLVPYKGPVLGWLAYRSLTRRRFVDLDFFVPHEEIPSAMALLAASGFSAEAGQQVAPAGAWRGIPGQYGFVREATRTHVELHTERTLRYFPVPLDFEKMRPRLISIEVAGEKLRTFSVEDTLVLLCVHGAKHFWDRIGWIVDVAELSKAQPVNWQKTLRIAAALKSTRLLLLGLYLAHELLGAPVPPAIAERARRDPGVVRLASKVEANFNGTSEGMGMLPRIAFRYRSRDGMLDAIRHGLRLAISPTESDLQALALPRWLTPLYSLVRPWRLLRDHGFGVKRQ